MSLTAEELALKTALETYGKTIDLEIKYGDTTYTSSDIISCTISFEGSLLTAIMKEAEIELAGVGGPDFAKTIKGEKINIALTVSGGGKTAIKDYGTFIVKEAEYKDETSSVVCTCYDLMLLAMTPYSTRVDFPTAESSEPSSVTLGDYLQAICDHIGVELATPTFTNSSVIIDGEKYDNSYTIRDVLAEIAQAAAGTITIKNDKLYVLYPAASGVIVEPSNLKSIEIGEVYGPINSVVLARTPQEDNIYRKDEAAETICEIKIENNQLMDSHREDFIEGIYNALYGLTYYPHEVESFGIGTLDICDLFTIETLDGQSYTALHLSGEIGITQGLAEKTKGAAPKATETEYKAADETDRRINKTILRVDKQEQAITALATKTENEKNDLTGQIETLTKSVEQKITPEQVQILISETVDGINSITTETGYTFNRDGMRIKKSGEEIENKLDHTGMYVNRDEDNVLTANHEGVLAINLTAREHLTIGQNSRFEDYEENRTALFYIGG